MHKKTLPQTDISRVISCFRHVYTVETVERMHRVTGRAFAVDGDAPLRERAQEKTYIDEWCFKQNDTVDRCTAPIIHGVPLCDHEQPGRSTDA